MCTKAKKIKKCVDSFNKTSVEQNKIFYRFPFGSKYKFWGGSAKAQTSELFSIWIVCLPVIQQSLENN